MVFDDMNVQYWHPRLQYYVHIYIYRQKSYQVFWMFLKVNFIIKAFRFGNFQDTMIIYLDKFVYVSMRTSLIQIPHTTST